MLLKAPIDVLTSDVSRYLSNGLKNIIGWVDEPNSVTVKGIFKR